MATARGHPTHGIEPAATFLLHLAPPGRGHLPAALAVAVAKAARVAPFSVHPAQPRGARRLAFTSAFLLVVLLGGLAVADEGTRFPLTKPAAPRSVREGAARGGHAPPGVETSRDAPTNGPQREPGTSCEAGRHGARPRRRASA
jgi:hypothetical protein